MKTKNRTPSFTLPYIPLLDLIFRYSLMKCYYLHGAKVSNYFDKVMTHLGHLLGGRWSEIMPCDGNIVGDCDRGDKWYDVLKTNFVIEIVDTNVIQIFIKCKYYSNCLVNIEYSFPSGKSLQWISKFYLTFTLYMI